MDNKESDVFSPFTPSGQCANRQAKQFYEQPKDQRRISHTKETIPVMPRTKPERETQAGSQPMRRGLGRRDYSSSQTAGARTGIPDHSCLPHLPLPPTPSSPPPSLHRALSSQQVDPWAREGGGGRRGRGGRGVTWTDSRELVVRKTFRRVDGKYLPSQTTLIKVLLTLQGV